MSNKVFNRYRDLAKRANVQTGTKESIEWFRKRIRKDNVSFNSVTEGLRSDPVRPGKMMTYLYDPKHEKKLKYYDTNPLIIVLDVTNNGWYGANVHYLPPAMRAALFTELDYNKRSLATIAKALENNSVTAKCLKRYLSSQTRSKPRSIPKDEWEIAIQLPFENFKKASMEKVWRDSRRR